jgi:type I restriction enzyme S subunit
VKATWTTGRLASVTTRITDGSHNPPKGGTSSEYVMLSSKNILDDAVTYEDPRYLSRADFELEDRRTGIRCGDILLTIVGTIGRCAVASPDMPKTTVQRSVAVIRPDASTLVPRFLMYSFTSRNAELNEQARGVAQKGIYLESLRELDVAYPPLPEQQRIVGILDEAFEGIATAKANAEKNLQNARALFESHLQSVFTRRENEVELSELASDITDGDHMPPPKAPSGVPFITISDIVKNTREIDFSNTFTVPTEYFRNLKPNKKPRLGDVLYTVTGATLGIPVLVKEQRDFCFQRHIGLVRPKPDTDSTWLSYALLSPQVFRQATLGSTGAAQKTVSLSVLRGLKVPKMALTEQKRIAAQVGAVFAETQRLASIYQHKLAALDELKKSLLHQAFSGEL